MVHVSHWIYSYITNTLKSVNPSWDERRERCWCFSSVALNKHTTPNFHEFTQKIQWWPHAGCSQAAFNANSNAQFEQGSVQSCRIEKRERKTLLFIGGVNQRHGQARLCARMHTCLHAHTYMCVCMHACVRACVHARARAANTKPAPKTHLLSYSPGVDGDASVFRSSSLSVFSFCDSSETSRADASSSVSSAMAFSSSSSRSNSKVRLERSKDSSRSAKVTERRRGECSRDCT